MDTSPKIVGSSALVIFDTDGSVDELPDYKKATSPVHFNSITFNKSYKPTDFILDQSFMPGSYMLVSEKLKNILSDLSLPNRTYYPIDTLLQNGKPINIKYHLLHIEEDLITAKQIDFSASVFVANDYLDHILDNELSVEQININSEKELLKASDDAYDDEDKDIEPRVLQFLPSKPAQALFALRTNTFDFVVNENFKAAMVKHHITGIDLSPVDYTII